MRTRHPTTWTFHRATTRTPFALPPAADAQASPPKEYPSVELVQLPAPHPLPLSLGEVLGRRVSCRSFSGSPLPLADLATLLAAAYGVRERRRWGELEVWDRSVPSAGGLYPLEIYVITQRVAGVTPGVHHYHPLLHALELLASPPPLSGSLSALFMGQPYVAAAPAIVVFAAVFERTMRKYGDRGYRYLLLEAGHAGQNLALTAACLGLGALSVGGFFDADLTTLLGLDGDAEAPIYVSAVGAIAADTVDVRAL
jgi:SagB-type dehydrogenase family enzyme